MMWTLTFEGGQMLQIQAGSNPPISHDGVQTVAHMYLSESEMSSLRGVALSRGIALSARPMQGQSPAQKAERERRSRALEVADFPCVDCVECSWSEPFQEEKCGLRGLPKESVEVLLRTSDKHRQDKQSCPL